MSMKKVLSVEDATIMRKIIKTVVGQIGYEVLEAENGLVALDLLNEQHEDIILILLDWNMPFKDGITTLKEIRADERYNDIPVMMVSTEAEKENIIRALKEGATRYLTKPFTQDDLKNSIEACLGMGTSASVN
jgi:two-component system, chemotaxis family, chemotaxis protein CheY